MIMQVGRSLPVVLLVACVFAVATDAQQNSAATPAPSPVFDTYTPGPCSPTGGEHGGCARGERVRIRVSTVA
ncbi:MAG TPA: hypothetical protein VH701_04190, partial [Vicinamibacterales bacterium]